MPSTTAQDAEHDLPSLCGCLSRHGARPPGDELDQATDHRKEGNGGGMVQVAASWGKKLGGSFRKRSKDRGRNPKEGKGAARGVPPSVLERAVSTSPGGDWFSDRISTGDSDAPPPPPSSGEAWGEAMPSKDDANEEPPPLSLVQRPPYSAPALDQQAPSTAIAAAAQLAINDSQFAGGAGPSQSEAGPSVMNTAVPAAIPATVEWDDAARRSGTQTEGAGSSPSDSSHSSRPLRRVSTKERLQDWAQTAFENGETQLSTAQVPVVEWSSLVGRRFLGSGESHPQHLLPSARPLRTLVTHPRIRASPRPSTPLLPPPHAPHAARALAAQHTRPCPARRAVPGEFCTVSSATLDGKQVAVKVCSLGLLLALGLLSGLIGLEP